jgi:hypothetical protein
MAVSPVITTGSGNEEVKEVRVAGYAANAGSAITAPKVVTKSTAEIIAEEAISLYNLMNLKKFGLSLQGFEYAWKGYKFLLEHRKINKNDVLSICDFSQSSRRKRFYVIDVEEKKVLINTWVAHGRNSGGEYARSFSNNPDSHKSSLGFYVTGGTYYGSHGLALKIDGVEKNINDKANERNIVIHGSEYVGAGFLSHSPINGRSFGCPALPSNETSKVIQTIKDGSCLFIYHPTKSYIQKSKVLNG